MQDENLFRKIKQAALHETSGTEDYDPEKIWSDIREKESRRTARLWWTYAAASVAFICGVYFFISPVSSGGERVAVNSGRAETPPEGSVKARDGNRETGAVPPGQQYAHVPASAEEVESEPKPTRGESLKTPAGLPSAPSAPVPIPSLPIAGVPVPTAGSWETPETNDTNDNRPPVRMPETEKVLIAEIDFPVERKGGPSTGPENSDQAGRDRGARRMRSKLDRAIKRPGIRAFVHNSFHQPPGPGN